MLKKIFSAFIVFTFLICTFVSCSNDKEVNVIYPISEDPACLDPQIAESSEEILITRNCMEGIVRMGADGEILPGVADSWKISSDGKKYVFHIRKGAMWQTLKSHADVLGEDYEKTFNYSVTAEDCAFGIIRALRPETKAEDAYMLYCISNAMTFNLGLTDENSLGVTASGDTLTITLERSNPDFMRILTYPMCMPCSREFFEATGAKYGLELKYTLCNGPFYVGSWVEDSSVTLYKSEKYKGENASSVSAMYFNLNSDDEQVVSKFNQEDYNAIPVKESYISKIENTGSVLFEQKYNIVSGLAFNQSDSFLSNENIRKALIYATDMSVLDEKGEYAAGVIPPSCRWNEKSYRDSAGAAEKPEVSSADAYSYFSKGLEELETANISITILCTQESRDDIIRLIQNWQKLFGFSITAATKVMEQNKIDESVKKGEYQIAFTSFEAEDGSAAKFLQKFCSDSEENFFSLKDDNYDSLVQKCLFVFEGDRILSGIKSAEQYLIANGIFYPLYNGRTCFAYRDDINAPFAVSCVSDIDFTSRIKADD